MITTYGLTAQNQLSKLSLNDTAALPTGAVWIDLQEASNEAMSSLARMLHIKIPLLKEVRLTDQAHQLYGEKNALHLTVPLLTGSQTDSPAARTLHFILTENHLVTVRDGSSHAFDHFSSRLLQQPQPLASAKHCFCNLLSALIARMADISEHIAHDMSEVSRLVFQESLQRSKAPGRGKADSWRKVLQGLGRTAQLNHRLITSLSGFERMMAFAQQPQWDRFIGEAERVELQHLKEDAKRLLDQAYAAVNEATFLLDSVASAISIEQNNVIKIFSMVSVVLMPPTMVASIYGMNFSHMPELGWSLGYPIALVIMIVSGILPLWWFKRNGWF